MRVRGQGVACCMGGKKTKELIEAVSNAASGYAVVVLALVCFVVGLMVVIALTRFFVGLSVTSAPSSSVQNNPPQVGQVASGAQQADMQHAQAALHS